MNRFDIVNSLSTIGLGLLITGLFIGSLWLVINGVNQLVLYSLVHVPLIIIGTVGVFVFARLLIEYTIYLVNGE